MYDRSYQQMPQLPCCPGKLHRLGCDVECCPQCGQQLISCTHNRPGKVTNPTDEERMPWTGEWPGAAECREFGWFAKLIPGRGWVTCPSDDPESEPDLNRIAKEAVWDALRKRFVQKANQGEIEA